MNTSENAPQEPSPQLPVSKATIAKEFGELARSEPDKFSSIFQLFIPDPSGGAPPIPQSLVEKALDFQATKNTQDHSFRLNVLYVFFGVIVMLLATVIVLVYLMRDHVEFAKQIIELLGLLITHTLVGGGAYKWGQAKGQARLAPPAPKLPTISASDQSPQ